PDLVFNNAPNDVETDHPSFNVKLSPTKPDQDLSHTYRPSTPIIEDWVSDSEDESETKTPQNVPSFVQSTEQVKSPRPSVQHVETSILAATPKPASPKPTSNGKRKNRKACFLCKSLDHLIKDCDYHEKKMAQTIARNHAHRGNHKQYAQMTLQNPQRHMVLVAILTQSKPVSITVVRPALMVNATKGMQGKWEWKPKCLILDHVSRNTSASMTLKRFDYNDALGRSKPSTPIIEDWVSDSEDESETKTPQNVPSFVQSTKQVKSPRPSVQHVETYILAATPKPASPKPTSNGKRKNRKACFVCKSLDHLIKDCDYHEKKMAQTIARNHAHRGNHKQYAQMTLQNPQRHMVPVAILTQSKPVSITVVRPVSTAIPKISVTRPRYAYTVVTKSNSPPRRHINRS
nr:hypothetical protein [Tanacetum cinerariifolium]